MPNPRKLLGRGSVRAPGSRRIVVRFDDETFAAIRRRAEEADTSFAEEVRTLVEWGLEDAEG
jgi:hypothetical protein